jgi:hypothetical protein
LLSNQVFSIKQQLEKINPIARETYDPKSIKPVTNAKPKVKKSVEKITLNDEVVEEYIELEKEIYRYEHKNVLKKYENKTIFADEIKKTVDQLEATFKELKKQT